MRGEPRADAAADLAIVFGEASLAAHAPALEERVLSVDPDDAEIAAVMTAVRASNQHPIVLAYRAHLHERQARAIDAILAHAPDTMVVSTGEPYDVPLFARATRARLYGNDDVSLAGLCDVIFLGVPCAGVLPIALA